MKHGFSINANFGRWWFTFCPSAPDYLPRFSARKGDENTVREFARR